MAETNQDSQLGFARQINLLVFEMKYKNSNALKSSVEALQIRIRLVIIDRLPFQFVDPTCRAQRI